MLKSIKIRIYPTSEQQIYINKMLGTCRFVYNCLYFIFIFIRQFDILLLLYINEKKSKNNF